MTQPGVSVTTPGMQQAASQFEQASSTATSQLTSVANQMAVLGSTWTGPAATKFGQAMNDWTADFRVIIDQLNNMIEVMGSNAKTYEAAEDTAVSTAGTWAGGLSGL